MFQVTWNTEITKTETKINEDYIRHILKKPKTLKMTIYIFFFFNFQIIQTNKNYNSILIILK